MVALPGGDAVISHTVLEGHRFAVAAIHPDAPLLSWGLPFGTALTPIQPGEYVCNQSMLDALAVRQIDNASLPTRPNFADRLVAFALDETSFRPAAPVPLAPQPRTFAGYRRSGNRGVGTRNTIVILGTTSRTAGFVRELARRLQPLARIHPELDGIVAIAHTEAGGPDQPNNLLEVSRALAGFIVHPNVGAVLAVDYGIEPLTNAKLEAFMRERGYPLDAVPHHFLSLGGSLAAGFAAAEKIVRDWLPAMGALRRTPEPLAGLRVALQCGGSDAFSGVSGNPLGGALVHEVIRHGGIGVLTETDELVGAESYLMRNMRDLATARAVLAKIDGFRERLRWHGVTPESNPSAGNKFRGLYNISLKSLGAVHKKDPRTRVDHVIEYAEPLRAPGFYFMNGPGNDLEGIAGQVGAGCNLFLFITGNGSITNFPFVPTLKITTTTRRHELLQHEMDINAGRYLDGEPMEAVAADAFELLVDTASGRKTKGEHAGHSQVSLWRNWRQTDASQVEAIRQRPAPDGKPLLASPIRTSSTASEACLSAFSTPCGWATERVGLVLPTSLCAAQIARMAAERLNDRQTGREAGISRFVGLTHTEGCGFGGETMYHLLHRTYRGYLTHPNVAVALLLEHGCEKVPNDVMRRQLEAAGIPVARFGWASVQLDGGIQKALTKIEGWFAERLPVLPLAPAARVDLRAVTLGLMSTHAMSVATAATFGAIAIAVLHDGGTILVPENDPLLASPHFREGVLGSTPLRPTLAYGQTPALSGFHVVATESTHWVENTVGLAGCGAHAVLGLVKDRPEQGHPLIPVLQVAEPDTRGGIAVEEIDAFLEDAPGDAAALLELLIQTLEHRHVPAAARHGLIDFQLTRGLLGVTT